MDINELCISCFKPTGGEEVCMHCGFIQSDTPKQQSHIYPHTVLNGRYIIGTVINNGGFGVVYKAYDIKLETIVAIKELFPTQNSIVNRYPKTREVIPVNQKREKQFKTLKKRFIEEAGILAKYVDCEGIVHVYDVFEENNTAYLVMEHLEGVTLSKLLDDNKGPIDFEESIRILSPVIKALDVLHRNNIIHCDISPDNIFVCDDGRVKLMDFSSAEFGGSEAQEKTSFVLKPGYTPPEQYTTSGKVGVYSDIYSLSAVLYRMVTGCRPDEAINRAEKDSLTRPSKLGVELPANAERAIMKALALRENARFKSANDFYRALLGRKKANFPEVELRKKKIIRTISVAAVFIVLAVTVFTVYSFKKSDTLVPDKSATVTLWYKYENENDSNKTIWESLEKQINNDKDKDNVFSKYVHAQNKDISIKLDVVGVKADEYDEKLEAAFENHSAPDIYEASNTKFDRNADSLGVLYSQFNENDYYKQPFDTMRNQFEKKNKIAFTFNVPALYSTSDFSTCSSISEAAEQGGKINADLSMLMYSAATYDYKPGEIGEILGNFNIIESVNNAKTQYLKAKKDSVDNNYVGMISDSIEIRYLKTNYYYCGSLPGANSICYIFPEVWSVSNSSDINNRTAAKLVMSYLMDCGNEEGQRSLTCYNKSSNNTNYYGCIAALPFSKNAASNVMALEKSNNEETIEKTVYKAEDKKATCVPIDELSSTVEKVKDIVIGKLGEEIKNIIG